MPDEVGYAYLSIIPKLQDGFGRSIERQLGPDFERAGRRTGKDLGRNVGEGARTQIASMSRGILAPLAAGLAALQVKDFVKDSIAEARESQKVGALTASIIKSTGGAAKVTAKDVDRLSSSMSRKTGIDDEVIASASNLLLTFKQVRNETGKNNQIFDRATRAAADLSAAGFGDLNGAAKQLGKALNDPVKGMTALTRSGVTFTAQQKKTIKELVAQNDILGAQKIILAEVESQVGGAAEATATLGEKSAVAWANIKEGFGTALLPLVDDMQAAFLEKGVPAAEQFVGWFEKDGIPALREFGDILGPLAESAIPAVGSALSTTKDVLADIAPILKGIIDGFNSLPDGLKSAIVVGGVGAAIGSKVTGGLGPIVLPGGGGSGSKGKAGGKSGGRGRGAALGAAGFLGIPLLDDVITGVEGAIQQRIDEVVKNGSIDKLRASMTELGKSTRITGKILREDIEKSNVGRFAEEFGIDIEAVAKSMLDAGSSGVAYRDTLRDIETQMREFENAGLIHESEYLNLKAARDDLLELGHAMDRAGEEAVSSKERQKQLFDLMLGGKGAADELGASLDALGRQKPTPTVAVNDRASRVIRGVKNLVKDLDGDRATITIAYNVVGDAVRRAAQSIARKADGGIVDFYAGGGIREDHKAQIAKAGDWRVWAEPETGGEAYLPLSMKKRPQTRPIAEEAIRRLGGSVQWHADGAIVAAGTSGGAGTMPDVLIVDGSDALFTIRGIASGQARLEIANDKLATAMGVRGY